MWPSEFHSSSPELASFVGNYFSGSILFVSSTHAAASDSNAGTEPELPKLTWTSAYDAASGGDVIVVAENHTETISSADSLATVNVTTVGLGSGSSKPRFTSAVAGAMWTLNASYQRFYNLYFPASTAATTARISTVNSNQTVIQGCDFECGANDATTALLIRTDNIIEGCTFTATASRPARAIRLTSTATSVVLRDVLVDGGAYGWSANAVSIEAALTLSQFENVRLANHSDIVFTTTGSSYRMFGVRPIDSTPCRITIAA